MDIYIYVCVCVLIQGIGVTSWCAQDRSMEVWELGSYPTVASGFDETCFQ
jgi:hypothetical protein